MEQPVTELTINVGDSFKVVNQQGGYDPITRAHLFRLGEGSTVHVERKFRGLDYEGREATFVTLTDLNGRNPRTVRIGTLYHAVGLVQENDVEGRFLPWETERTFEDLEAETVSPFSSLAEIKAQMEAQEAADNAAKRAAIEEAGAVFRLARVLPAPYAEVACEGDSITLLEGLTDGRCKVSVENFPLPFFVSGDALVASIAAL